MGEMLDIAFRHGATLDKLIGDAIVAFFNAPVGQPDHRARAVACALEMDTFGTAFVDRQAAKGVVVGSTRIGVHTGFAIVGNFGGNKFFDYTGLGDTVNTAARLESANKHLGTRVCISGSTASGCPNAVLRVVGTLILKGKSQGIEVYEPLLNERIKSEVVTAYEEAMAKLKQNDSSAAEAFKKVLAIDPTDVLAMFHLRRLESGATGPLILMEEK
jgi:adenylate cyclase